MKEPPWNRTYARCQITTSYGDEEQTVPHDYATHVCNLFAQLGSRGVTLLFASGDSGVGGGKCLTNDGKNRTAFVPAFPGTRSVKLLRGVPTLTVFFGLLCVCPA